jgi:PDZ domain-containing protein
VRRPSWPTVALILGAAVLALATILYVAPADDYILLPDDPRALDPLVRVPNEKADVDAGGLYYVAVDVRRATKLEQFFPSLHDGATLVPEEVYNPGNVDDDSRRQEELREMRQSQRYATAVALQALGYDVKIEPRGARVEQTVRGYPAAGRLRRGDVIVAADGRTVRFPDDLTRIFRTLRPGETANLRVRRDGRVRPVAVRTVPNPADSHVPFIGVQLAEPKVTLPVQVNFDLGRVGGPSAGLAFALDLVNELGGEDIDRGRRIAATGEIRLDGSVRKVGGIKQKVTGARRSGMDLMLVPGENAEEARRYADGLRIVPVDSFQQALSAVATPAQND